MFQFQGRSPCKSKIAVLPPGVDQEALEVMDKFIEQLTTTGKEELDVKLLKPLFDRAGTSVAHLKLFSELLFRQMEVEHAQVRYSSLLILNELVKRSKHFRKELFFSDERELINRFMELTMFGRTKASRKGNAKKLRPQFVADKLRERGIQFLRQWSLDYDGDWNVNRSFSQCLVYVLQNLGMDVPVHVGELHSPKSSNSTVIPPKMALEILKREFESNEEEMMRVLAEIKSCFSLLVPKFDSSEDSAEEDAEKKDASSASPVPSTSSVPVFIAPNGLIKLRRNVDNDAILDNLIGLYKRITNRFIPLLDSWLKSSDLENDPVLEVRMEETKSKLEFEKSRYERLHIKATYETDSSDMESEDSDLEEVETQPEWMSLPCITKLQTQENDNSSYFQPGDLPGSSGSDSDDAPSPATTIPSKQSCRAALGNGKLCSRNDLQKCPFHGKIIPRDEQGNPTEPEDIEAETKKRQEADSKKKPDWQDPTYLKELKAKIGMDLTIRKGRKGKKSFEERYPGLISLRQNEDTPRKRLARKLAKLQGNAKKRRRVSSGDGNQFSVEDERPVLHYS